MLVKLTPPIRDASAVAVLAIVMPLWLYLYGITVQLVEPMDTVTVNRFRDNLKAFIEQVVSNHAPIKVTRRAGEAFVVISADDWEREQETLYVLQNTSLMKQIADSLTTHNKRQGYVPTSEEVDEITRIRG